MITNGKNFEIVGGVLVNSILSKNWKNIKLNKQIYHSRKNISIFEDPRKLVITEFKECLATTETVKKRRKERFSDFSGAFYI